MFSSRHANSFMNQSVRVQDLIEQPVNQTQIIHLHMETEKLKLEIQKLTLELTALKNMVTEIYQVPGGPNYFKIYTDYLQNLNALSPNNSAAPVALSEEDNDTSN